MNYGYQNEYDFVELFNGKYLYELDNNYQKFLKELFGGDIDDYVWILKYDLYDLILKKRCLDFTSPHVACMTIGPNFIREDIINLKKGK